MRHCTGEDAPTKAPWSGTTVHVPATSRLTAAKPTASSKRNCVGTRATSRYLRLLRRQHPGTVSLNLFGRGAIYITIVRRALASDLHRRSICVQRADAAAT